MNQRVLAPAKPAPVLRPLPAAAPQQEVHAAERETDANVDTDAPGFSAIGGAGFPLPPSDAGAPRDFSGLGPRAPGNIDDADLARALITRLLLEQLAPWLGLDPARVAIRIGPAAEARTNAAGASGLQEGATIYLHPARYQPRSREGRYLLTHEAVHAAQRTLAGEPDPAAAETEAAQIASAFVANEPLRRPLVPVPSLAVAADTGPVPEPSFETLALQNREPEMARIRELLHGLWISDGDVEKVLLILKSLPPPTAYTLIAALETGERVDLVDNMHSVHRKGFRAEVLICYRALSASEVTDNFDEDLFEDMDLSNLEVQEAFTIASVVGNLKSKAKNKLRKGDQGRAIHVIEQFAADPDNKSRWQTEVQRELDKAHEEERGLRQTRKETESIWQKDQSSGGKLEKLVASIREKLDAWIVTDKDALEILDLLQPYTRDLATLRAIADGLVTHHYQKRGDEYHYEEDKDYLQELIDQVPVKALYNETSPRRRVFLQLLLVRPGYKSIESVLKLTDEINVKVPVVGLIVNAITGFFSHVDSEEAYLAYQIVRSMPARARKAIMEYQGGETWGKVTANMSVSQFEGDTTNFYQGGKNGEDRDALLTQLLYDEVWSDAPRLRGVVGMAISAGHYDWVFGESRRHYEADKHYANHDVAAVVEMYKLYNPQAVDKEGHKAPRLTPDQKLLEGNPFWNEGNFGWINQKVIGGLDFIFSSKDVETAATAMGGTGLNLAEFQDITGGTFLGARFESLDKLGMEGAEAKRRQQGVNFANVQWDRNLGVLKLQAEHLAIAAINYPLTDQTIRTGRMDLRNVDVTLRYPTGSTKNQLNVIDVSIGEAQVDDLRLIAPDSMKAINTIELSGLRILVQPSGKDVSQLDKPRDGMLVDGVGGMFANIFLFPFGGAAGVGAAANVVGSAASGKELGSNVLKPSTGMEMQISLRSVKLSGIATSGGSYVASVVIENLDIGGGGTVQAYLSGLETSILRLTTRLRRERDARDKATDDKARLAHDKASDQLEKQIAHAKAEIAQIKANQAEIKSIEERQKALAAEKPPKELSHEDRERLKVLKSSLMGTVMDVGHVKISGIADSPVKDLDLGNLHGQGHSTTALLGMLSESDILSRFIEGGQPVVKEPDKHADFTLDIGHVELPDLKLAGGIPSAADAQKDLETFRKKADASRPEHIDRLARLEQRVDDARKVEEYQHIGPERLTDDQRRDFLQRRKQLQDFEEDNAFRIQSVVMEGASLRFDQGGGVGVGADELTAVGLRDPKTGLTIDSVYARQFALDAKLKEGVLGLKDWRKNLQSGQLGASYLQVKGFVDPESGLGAEEIVAEGEGEQAGLSAGLDINEGNASARVAAPKITVKGASAAFSERVLRMTKSRLDERLRDPKLEPDKRKKGQKLLKEVDAFLGTLDAVKDAIAKDKDQLAAAIAAQDEKKKEAASRALAMDEGNLKTWLQQLSLAELTVKDLNLSLRGLGAVLDENWSFDDALDRGVTFEAGTPGGAIVGSVGVKGLSVRQNGREMVTAQEITTGPIKGRIVYSRAFIRIEGLEVAQVTVNGASYLSPSASAWTDGTCTLTRITVSAVIHSQPRPEGKDARDTYLSKVDVDDFHIDRIDAQKLGYEDRGRGLRVDVSSGALRDIYMRGMSFEFSPDELEDMKIKEDKSRGTPDKPTGIGVGHFDDVKLGARLAGGLTMGGRLNASTLAVHFAESGGKEIDLASLSVAEGKVKKGDLDLDVDADVKGIHVSLLPGGVVKGRARDVSVGVSGSKGKHRFGARIEHADTGEVTYDGRWVTMPALDLPSLKLNHLFVKTPDLELDIPVGQEAELIGTRANVDFELNDDPKHGAVPVRRIYIHDLSAAGLALHGFTARVPALDLSITLPPGLSGFIGGIYVKPGADFPEGFIIEPEPGDFPLGKGVAYGAFGFKSASLIKLNANLKDVLDATANLKAEGFEMGFLSDGSFTVDLQQLTGDNVSGTIEHAKLKGSKFSFLGGLGKTGNLPGVDVRGIHYDKDTFSIEGATIRGVRFDDPGHGVTVKIDEATLPVDAAGKPAFKWPKSGPAVIPSLDIVKARFDIDFTRIKSSGSSSAAPKPGPWNFDFLDKLNGSLRTDVIIPGLTVKLTGAVWRFSGGADLPVPTDTFPIQMRIRDGIINYADLEKKAFSRSKLVQDVLDFEVKGNKLVLEADLSDIITAAGAAGGSVVPGAGTVGGAVVGAAVGAFARFDIIEWDLTPYEQVLAENDKVRLATLAVGLMKFLNKPKTVSPHFNVDVDARWSDLELRNVEVNLGMKGGGVINLAGVTGDPSVKGQITLGGPGGDAIVGLTAKGGSKSGIDIGLDHAELGVKDLELGGMTLNVGSIVVDKVHDVTFKMVSGKPGSLSGTIDSASGRNVRLTK